jgi:hypothetical protein
MCECLSTMWITSILKCGVCLWTLMYMYMLFVDSHVWMILFM